MCSHSAPIANAERQVAMWSVLFRMPAQPGEAKTRNVFRIHRIYAPSFAHWQCAVKRMSKD